MRDPILKFYDKDRAMTYNSMFYWWSRIKNLDIPMPKTEMIWLGKDKSYDLFSALDGNTEKSGPILDEVYEKIIEKFPPGPMFIRGDHTSDKQLWEKTCFIKNNRDKTDVINHLIRLIEGHDLHVFIGPPMLGYALREIIPTDPIFYTFHGNMPITREFRFFYSEGEVACYHPYWPPEAIEHQKRFAWGKDLPEDWKEKLDSISHLQPEILELLTDRAIAIGKAIECDDVPSWSIDFLQGSDGIFYFIDCADALASEHWNDCPVGQEKFGWIPRVHEKVSDFSDFLAELGITDDNGGK